MGSYCVLGAQGSRGCIGEVLILFKSSRIGLENSAAVLETDIGVCQAGRLGESLGGTIMLASLLPPLLTLGALGCLLAHQKSIATLMHT